MSFSVRLGSLGKYGFRWCQSHLYVTPVFVTTSYEFGSLQGNLIVAGHHVLVLVSCEGAEYDLHQCEDIYIMCGWYIYIYIYIYIYVCVCVCVVLCLFLDNSDSLSIVEQ